MNLLTKTSMALGLIALSSASIAGPRVNAYTYDTVYENAIKDSKWQVGYNSERQCVGTECASTMSTSESLNYVWVDQTWGSMRFSTDGSKDTKWRNELRFEDNFSRGSSRVMTARLRFWESRSSSLGFTIAQLHMDTNQGWDVEGPPARLEVINEDHFRVDFRSGYDCTSDCWSKNTFSASVDNWKDIQMQTSGDYINVSVEGETHSYYLKSTSADAKNWPSQGGYFWKTGIYLQKAGEAYVAYDNLYW